MANQALEDKLRYLRLSAMQQTVQQRNQYALDNKLSYMEFFEMLIEDECARRKSNAHKQRLAKSRLHPNKTFDNYDFSFQPELDKQLVHELLGCRFIDAHKNIIFLGKPGVGKTHLANAIGLQALNQGYKVLFAHANSLMDKLLTARADESHRRLIASVIQADLLIIDELGFRKIPQEALDDFFEIIRTRYEAKPTIFTSNRNFEDWEQIFGDRVLAGAIIDRIVHHAYIFKITGDSYRIKNFKQDKKKN
ncbi:MAG: IS21-like element helper ATPase IstB [Phaeodactylibacter sp.]|nr:IS21-like element helper ATPase IstB [Phaeodactylibacter sp.]